MSLHINGMDWTLLVVLVLTLTCVQVSCGRAEAKRLSRMEETLHKLSREVKDLKAVRCRQERTSETGTSSQDIQLAKDTLSALEVESRALSQFDSQMRDLQNSLEHLHLHKGRQAETIESFRHEITQLKKQVESLLEKSDGFSRKTRDTTSENAVKTLQWLLKSVSNLKADVALINQNLNVTRTMQNSEEIQKQMNLVQDEIHQLRHQLTEESAERQRLAAEVVQLRTDLKETTENNQNCLKNVSDLSSRIQSLKADLEPSTEPGTLATTQSRSGRFGHWNHKFNELSSAVQSVRDKQHHLERKLNSLTGSTATAALLETIQSQMGDLSQQYSRLESKLQVNEAALSAIEASHNTMHERMALIGEQNDFQTRESLVTLDELHFNVSQMEIQWEKAFQYLESTNDKVTRISERVMHIESEMERDRISLLGLQNRAMNETLQKCKDETKEQIQDLKLQTVLYQLDEIKQQINSFNKTMENWNGAFTLDSADLSVTSSGSSSSSEESDEK